MEYVLVARRRFWPKLFFLFFLMLAWESFKLHNINGHPIQGLMVAAVFIAIAFWRRTSRLVGMLARIATDRIRHSSVWTNGRRDGLRLRLPGRSASGWLDED
jgi:hypothetical protein